MEIPVTLESSLKKLYFLVTLDTLDIGICAAFLIAVGLIQFGHLLDGLFVLVLDLQLELELLQHSRDFGGSIGRLGLD